MLKPLFAAALVTLAACGPGVSAQTASQSDAGPLTVDWTIGESGKDPAEGKVQFGISRRTATSNWMHSTTTPLADLQGLTAAQLGSADGAPVRFRVDRDSGSLDCEGIVRRRRGTGECSFVPDPRFTAALQQRGIGTATPVQLFSMAMGKVGPGYVEELERQRYARPTVEDLVKAGNHGAGLDYLRGMGALGYRAGTVAALVRMRDHGVTPAYVQELTALGIRDVAAADLVRLRDHGVSARYVGELRQLGYDSRRVDELIRLRDHGVSAAFVRDLSEYGIRGLPTADLVRLRSHGVSARYVGELRQLGYTGLSADEIVRLRTHGVTSDFIRRTNAGGRRSVDELVRMRTSG